MEDLKYRQMRCEEAYGKHGAVGIKIMLAIDPVLSKEDEWALWGTFSDAVEMIKSAVMEYTISQNPEAQAEAADQKRNIISLFDSPIYVEEIPNCYCDRWCCKHLPWFVVTTRIGRFKIGWRKQVISIDWTETTNKQSGAALFPDEGVTKSSQSSDRRFIHAWDHENAREYIQKIMEA